MNTPILEKAIEWLTSNKDKHTEQARVYLKEKGENFTYETGKSRGTNRRFIKATPKHGDNVEIISVNYPTEGLSFETKRKKVWSTLYIYIMYSSKTKAYKIGETRNLEKRLKDIRRGGTHGDSSVILVDSFPVDDRLLIGRAKIQVDHHFHSGKPYYFSDGKNHEWFDVSLEEAREAVKRGFERLEKDASLFRKKRLNKKVNRRLLRLCHIALSSRKTKCLTLLQFSLRCFNRTKELDIEIKLSISDKLLKRVFTTHNRLYIDHTDLFTPFISTDKFLRGVFLTSQHYRDKDSKGKLSRRDLEYMREYHKLILDSRDYVLSALNDVVIYESRSIWRDPILRLSSRLMFESHTFALCVRRNSYLITIEFYFMYNERIHNEKKYFLRLEDMASKFNISFK